MIFSLIVVDCHPPASKQHIFKEIVGIILFNDTHCRWLDITSVTNFGSQLLAKSGIDELKIHK